MVINLSCFPGRKDEMEGRKGGRRVPAEETDSCVRLARGDLIKWEEFRTGLLVR